MLRGQFFNTFYAESSSGTVDATNLKKIVHFAKATRRLDPGFEPPDNRLAPNRNHDDHTHSDSPLSRSWSS